MTQIKKIFSITKFLAPSESEKFHRRSLLFFTSSYLLTLACFIFSFLMFPLQSGFISVFFVSFSLIPTLENILERNKNDIWQKRTTPFKANLDMAVSLTLIFLGILLAYSFIMFAIPSDYIEKLFFSQVHDTMTHTHLLERDFVGILSKRLTVGLIFFLVSFIFRIGSMFVLVWIASVWGVVYGVFLKNGCSLDLPTYKHYLIVVSVAGFLVMLVRTFGFITASMAGVFLSKGFSKYTLASPEFKQVSKAVLTILAVSLVLMFLSVVVEFRVLAG